MKLLTFSVLTLAFAFSAIGANKLGSQCGLLDSFEGEQLKAIGKGVQLDLSTPSDKVRKLPTLTKQQLIIAAKYFANENGESIEIKNTQDAINFLSGSDGINVDSFKVNKLRVTEVMYYPGENPYSVVFLLGTTHILAFGQDGTVVCR